MRGLGGVTVFAGSRASTVNAASEPGSSPHCWELHQAAGDHTAESVSDGVGGGGIQMSCWSRNSLRVTCYEA